ncbi:MAG: hypothetical protein IT537_06500 [Hyphomicrobiales bacterium]|nr:hypothetical protein [Hyphomicrobiales bacterium]
MAISRSVRHLRPLREPWPYGPVATLALALAAVCAVIAFTATTAHPDFVLPAASLGFFALAALVALRAAAGSGASHQPRFSHWDAAGLLTLVGICAASQVEPEQMVRLVEGAQRRP